MTAWQATVGWSRTPTLGDTSRFGLLLFQVLTLANHPRLWEKIRDPAGRVAKLAQEADEGRRIEELFLATVSRLPDETERTACRKYLKEAESTEKGLHGLLWGLLNTREFLLQH